MMGCPPRSHPPYPHTTSREPKNPKVSPSKRKKLPTTETHSPARKRVSPRKHLQSRSSSRPKQSNRIDTIQLRNDRLGTLVKQLCIALEEASSWEDFVETRRGRSYLSSEIDDIKHPAKELLRHWREHGVPVNSTSPPWTDDQKETCINRGCHKSATEHRDFIRTEMAEFIESKYWAVLPYRLVRALELLQMSPAAVKDERDRKPRLLCDHTWPWGWPSINETTAPHAPPEAMQFGGTFARYCRLLRHSNPKFGPVRTAKFDVKDGFYRLFLDAAQCLRLGRPHAQVRRGGATRGHTFLTDDGLGPVSPFLLCHVRDHRRLDERLLPPGPLPSWSPPTGRSRCLSRRPLSFHGASPQGTRRR